MIKSNIIYAVGVHQGGGKTVFEDFISHFENFNHDSKVELIIDDRLKNDFIDNKNFKIRIVSSKFHARIIHEYQLKKYSNSYNIIFINGLPPIFKLKARTVLFFQNANILSIPKQISFLDWLLSFDFLRYLKFIFFKNNIDEWFVYSETSKSYIKKYLNIIKPIKKINTNFVNQNIYLKINKTQKTLIYDLFYPASGEIHKNHKNLMEALIYLSKFDLFPKVLLTLKKNEFKRLNIDKLIHKYNLNIVNEFFETKKELYSAYASSKAVIYPSFHETLGLPLLEAKAFDIDIIASESDYVRDNISPVEVFDPTSPISISRAIIRYFDYPILIDNKINHKIVIEYLLNQN